MNKKNKIVLEPSINVYSKEEFINRIALVKNLASVIQIDVVDGIFTKPKNFAEPRIVFKEIKPEKVHIHLMVKFDQKEIEKWAVGKPKRITIHLESGSSEELEFAFKRLKSQKIERGLAISPLTSLDLLNNFSDKIDFLLILAVHPGRGGQKFSSTTFQRLVTIKKKFPKLKIGVDGGVGREHLEDLRQIGLNSVAVGSALFNSPRFESTFQEFNYMLN